MTTDRTSLGVAQLLPAFVTPAAGFALGRATGDPGLGTLVGAEVGAILTAVAAGQSSEVERVQRRVLEAFIDRSTDELGKEPKSME